MAKHRLQRESNVTRSVRGALVVGAVTVGGASLAAAPAMAATVTIPGIGDFAVPDMPAAPQLPALPALPEFQAVPGGQPAIPGLPALPDLSAIPGLPGLPAIQEAPSHGRAALDAARSKVGAPYVWGASGPSAFDCSGLVQWAYRQAGVSVPRTSYEQAQSGTPVSFEELQPGDVVLTNGGSHAAIYAGDGQILHATVAGQPVKYAALNSQSFYAARRY